MRDVLETISTVLGIVVSCITIYQFFAKRPAVVRLRRTTPAQLPQESHAAPALRKSTTPVSQAPAKAVQVSTREYVFALLTFIIMPIIAFFMLYFYTNLSNYGYSSQEVLLGNSVGALLAGSSLALMILLLATSRKRAILAATTFVIMYCLVLLGVSLLHETIYFALPIFNSALLGGNLLAVVLASLVTLVTLRGRTPF